MSPAKKEPAKKVRDEADALRVLCALRVALEKAGRNLSDAYSLACDSPEKVVGDMGDTVTQAERLVGLMLRRLEERWPTASHGLPDATEKCLHCHEQYCDAYTEEHDPVHKACVRSAP